MNWIPLEIDARLDGKPVTLKLEVNFNWAGKIQIRLSDTAKFITESDRGAIQIVPRTE